MIKQRYARYCNLKLILIFTVIYGHLIEDLTDTSYIAEILYRGIYFVHMPLFSFMSGLFVKSKKDCSSQLVKLLKTYIPCQLLAVILSWGRVELFTPWWHLWYLLSTCIWLAAGWVWLKWGRDSCKTAVILFCAVLGCAVGFLPRVGRVMSLSRTAVFLPYFMAGVMSDPRRITEDNKTLAAVCAIVALILTVTAGRTIPTEFLYQAEAYGSNTEVIYRIVCYITGGFAIVAALTFAPNRRYFFTKLGTDTMPVYLLHAPIVLLVRRLEMDWCLCIPAAAVIIVIIYRITRWYGGLYRITGRPKRGDSG
ncbi:MAG: acyltransferase family protein [Clostridia bacterium]|nr:acyltransferase family protein [Clostridia bacterium]